MDSKPVDPSPRHASNQDGERVLDDEVLSSLLALGGEEDAEFLLEIIDLFLGDAARRMAVMDGATHAGDLEAVRATAHALKSASANVGACSLAAACKEIEYQARARQEGRVQELVATSHGIFARVERALTELRVRYGG